MGTGLEVISLQSLCLSNSQRKTALSVREGVEPMNKRMKERTNCTATSCFKFSLSFTHCICLYTAKLTLYFSLPKLSI